MVGRSFNNKSDERRLREWHHGAVPRDWLAGRQVHQLLRQKYCFFKYISPLLLYFHQLITTLGQHHWEEVEKRRTWFQDLARERSFDPLVDENWYSFAREWKPDVEVC